MKSVEVSAPAPSTPPEINAVYPKGDGGLSMPLMRGRIVGYDAERMTFQFTMLNEGETVECWISSAAMGEIAGKRGLLPAQREAQFLELREEIERIASDIFNGGTIVRGAFVRVFAKHIRK
jgi:hypothetical protein